MKVAWINLRTDLFIDRELLDHDNNCIVDSFVHSHWRQLSHVEQFGSVQILLEKADEYPDPRMSGAWKSITRDRERASVEGDYEESTGEGVYEQSADNDELLKRLWRTEDRSEHLHRDPLGIYATHHETFHRPSLVAFPRLILETTKGLYQRHQWPVGADGLTLPFVWLLKSVAVQELAHAFMDGRYARSDHNSSSFGGDSFDWRKYCAGIQPYAGRTSACSSCDDVFNFRPLLKRYYQAIEESLATAIQLRQPLPYEGKRLMESLIAASPAEYRLSSSWQDLPDDELMATASSWRKFKALLVSGQRFHRNDQHGELALHFLEGACGFLRRRQDAVGPLDFYDGLLTAVASKLLASHDTRLAYFVELCKLNRSDPTCKLDAEWFGYTAHGHKRVFFDTLLTLLRGSGFYWDFASTAICRIKAICGGSYPWPEFSTLKEMIEKNR